MKKSIVSPGFVKRTLAKLLKLDQQLGIVVDGNVASQAIAVGKYVNLINSTITGKPDGIYVATGAVSSGGTVTAADISGNAVSDGVTNELSEHIVPLSGIKNLGDITDCNVPNSNKVNGLNYFQCSGSADNSPIKGSYNAWPVRGFILGNSYGTQIAFAFNKVFIRSIQNNVYGDWNTLHS